MNAFFIKDSPEGKPAIYSSRGIICVFEAGNQSTRERDAREVCEILNRDRRNRERADLNKEIG